MLLLLEIKQIKYDIILHNFIYYCEGDSILGERGLFLHLTCAQAVAGSPDWRVELRGGAGESSGNVWASDQAGVLRPVCQEYHWSGGEYSKYGDWGKHEADVVCR